MTCAEFQKVLPYIIDGGANAEQEAHLATCHTCSDLVQDLRYIAEQAKLLVPMHDPNPRVWNNIERSLESGRASSPSRIEPPPANVRQHSSVWRGLGWAAGIAVLVLLTFTLLRPNLRTSPQLRPVDNAATPAAKTVGPNDVNNEDLQVLAVLSPDVRGIYESSLKQVNGSIVEAKQTIERNPEDETARNLLAEAYQQKAMLYERAMAAGDK